MAKQTGKEKLTEEKEVVLYMAALEHPLKAGIETLRTLIKNTHPSIKERIKWNAPSYYCPVDFLTFGPLKKGGNSIMLVFHHPHIVEIQSALLEGAYKDRRLVTLGSLQEIETNQKELVRIIQELVSAIQAK